MVPEEARDEPSRRTRSGPVIVRWYIQRTYQAVRTIALTAIAPVHQWCWNAAMRTRISDTNGERPGRLSAARPKTRNRPARTGATFSVPPIARIEAVPRRLI